MNPLTTLRKVSCSSEKTVRRTVTPSTKTVFSKMRLAPTRGVGCVLLTRSRRGAGPHMTTADVDIYYDPYDRAIDEDPYPVWRRLRDERPLYYNEKYDFYALSRFDDVRTCSVDWETYISSKSTVLELIKEVVKSGAELPRGSIIFEDPPTHDLHRGLLSRAFTPRRMKQLEPKVREFCARSLDPLVGADGFDFVRDIGAPVPMRTIGMLLGIPEQDQEAIREQIDEVLRLKESGMPVVSAERLAEDQSSVFAEYINWRAEHASDD